MLATQIITATGECLYVEASLDRCWHSEEVADFPVTVSPETVCDICGEPLNSINCEQDDEA